jgi:hypothetical protein
MQRQSWYQIDPCAASDVMGNLPFGPKLWLFAKIWTRRNVRMMRGMQWSACLVLVFLTSCAPRLETAGAAGGTISNVSEAAWSNSPERVRQIAGDHCARYGSGVSNITGEFRGARNGMLDARTANFWRFTCNAPAPHTADSARQQAIEMARSETENERREERNFRMMQLGLGMAAGAYSAPPPPQTRTYIINGRPFHCSTTGGITNCF